MISCSLSCLFSEQIFSQVSFGPDVAQCFEISTLVFLREYNFVLTQMVYKYLNRTYELKKPAFLVPACNTVSDNPGHFKCKICHFNSLLPVVMPSKLQEHFFFFLPALQIHSSFRWRRSFQINSWKTGKSFRRFCSPVILSVPAR